MSVQEKITALLSDPSLLPYAIWEHAMISPKDITFSEAVRKACEVNYCGRYGKCWTCPPGAGDWQVLRDHFKAYEHAFVFTTKYDLEDPFDVEGMDEAREQHSAVDKAILALLEGEEPHELAGAGSCKICEKCTYPDAPCRFPDKARRSMEACGIDVVNLSKDCGIHYINGADTVTYFSIIFW